MTQRVNPYADTDPAIDAGTLVTSDALPQLVRRAGVRLVALPLRGTPSAELDFGAYPLTHGGSQELDLTPEAALVSRLDTALALLEGEADMGQRLGPDEVTR